MRGMIIINLKYQIEHELMFEDGELIETKEY